jgi:hypothetical protein
MTDAPAVALAGLLILIGGFWGIAALAGRSRELFVLSVRAGRTELVRGQVPPALMDALGDVMRRAQVERATVRVIRENGRAAVQAEGLSEPVLQRARNVVGTYPLQKLLGAQRLRARR